MFRRGAQPLENADLVTVFGPTEPPRSTPTHRPHQDDAAGDWFEQAIHRPVIIHTAHDKSYEGLLHRVCTDGVVLWTAKLLGKQEVALAGEVFIPRDQVVIVEADPVTASSKGAPPQ